MTKFADKTAKAIELLNLVVSEIAGEDQRARNLARTSVKKLAEVFSESDIPYRVTRWDGFGSRTRLWMFHDISNSYIRAIESVVPAEEFVSSMGFRSSSMTKESMEKWLKIVESNRINWMLARMKAWNGPRFVSGTSLNWDLNAYVIETVANEDDNLIYASNVISLLEAIKEREEVAPDKEMIKNAREMYDEYINEKNYHLKKMASNTEGNGTSFADLIRKRTQMLADTELETKVLEQFEGFKERLEKAPTTLVQRTWGWEMEIADAKGVDVPANSKVQKGSDGSLRSYESGSDDCECDCSDCTYHECNCDYCDNYNDSPEHCGDSSCVSADCAEFRTVGPIIKSKHPALKTICQELVEVNAEVNDTCGVHIHVYGADMKAKHIGNLIAIYMYLKPVLSPIAGRENEGYAQRMPVMNALRAMRKGQLSYNKPLEVNANHLNGIGTIEFRQMAGTCDYKAIQAWAWIVRGLTEAANRGAQLRDFMHVNDLDQLLQVLIYKFSHNKEYENLDGIVYGSKMDQGLYKANQFEYSN